MFHSLTIADLHLGLDELLARRLHALRATAVGRCTEPRLRWHRLRILKSVQPPSSTRPPVERLAIASAAHDALGTIIHHLLEAHLGVPDRSEGERQMLQRMRHLFMPRLAELRDDHATVAARALARREQLQAHVAELSTIVIREDETLAHWVRAFVEQGCKIGALLARGADLGAEPAGVDGPQRSAAIGVLGRLRVVMADELVEEPLRLRQLDAELFGGFDQLAREEISRRALLGPRLVAFRDPGGPSSGGARPPRCVESPRWPRTPSG